MGFWIPFSAARNWKNFRRATRKSFTVDESITFRLYHCRKCVLTIPLVIPFPHDPVVKYKQRLAKAREMRRGRKLRVEWAAGDDAASLRARYGRERRADVRTRLQGLWLVRTGRTTREVAEVVGVEERTVQRWLAWYREGGLAAVTGRHAGGHGAPSFLTADQRTELADEVATGRFRTAAEIRRWVQERWGVSYTEGGMYALLGRLRCAPKVPRPVHEKADHLAQVRWKKGGSPPALTQSA